MLIFFQAPTYIDRFHHRGIVGFWVRDV